MGNTGFNTGSEFGHKQDAWDLTMTRKEQGWGLRWTQTGVHVGVTGECCDLELARVCQQGHMSVMGHNSNSPLEEPMKAHGKFGGVLK